INLTKLILNLNLATSERVLINAFCIDEPFSLHKIVCIICTEIACLTHKVECGKILLKYGAKYTHYLI
ncbi:hypothetical protein CDAR_299711, partial [Caerostris darwini]